MKITFEKIFSLKYIDEIKLVRGTTILFLSAQGYQEETEFDTTALKQQRRRRQGKHH